MKGLPALRLVLPPLRDVQPDSVLEFAAYSRAAPPIERGQQTLAELGRRWPGAKVDAILHSADLTLAQIRLPPLSAQDRRVAVTAAIEPFMLGDPSTTLIGYGPRAADGGVSVGWVDRDDARAASHCLRECGLMLRTLWPTPFFLPAPHGGWVAWCRDDYVAVRSAQDQGFVLPIAADAAKARLLAQSAQEGLAQMVWIGEVPAWWSAQGLIAATAVPLEACWQVQSPPWSIGVQTLGVQDGTGASSWLRTTAWAAAAALIWIGGLNIYAARLDHAGRTLKSDIAQRVKTAFPNVRTVVEPLRQARQQRDAQQVAAAQAEEAELAFLLEGAREHMAFAAGQVQRLDYRDGALDVVLMRGTSGAPAVTPVSAASSPAPGTGSSGRRRASDQPAKAGEPAQPAWIAAAEQAGLEVEPIERGWRLRRAAPAPQAAVRSAEGTTGRPAQSAAAVTVARRSP
ncbi:general secretion pathway protein L [Bordetella ansorpii]|uniref:General secretion pathway protein L n=1 Tax=Bordetella ansorpii TaxID=288768 RepID=A0A157SRE8_9BORD|nr:type II secretion system protein GspL [Bordetella ansorpii]SAI72987.1 general secretion pathway protein L [Bordetella ansorpii]